MCCFVLLCVCILPPVPVLCLLILIKIAYIRWQIGGTLQAQKNGKTEADQMERPGSCRSQLWKVPLKSVTEMPSSICICIGHNSKHLSPEPSAMTMPSSLLLVQLRALKNEATSQHRKQKAKLLLLYARKGYMYKMQTRGVPLSVMSPTNLYIKILTPKGDSICRWDLWEALKSWG